MGTATSERTRVQSHKALTPGAFGPTGKRGTRLRPCEGNIMGPGQTP